jgi:hypothetical protein
MMRRLLGLSALALAIAAPLGAQAYVYPAFQPTRVAEREYNFALVDISQGGGTGLIFQWREGLGNPRAQFTLDAGFADPDAAGADTRLILGAGFAYQMLRERQDMPFDMVFTGGVGASFGNDVSLIRIPVGVAVGHRFPLEGNFAITPYVHPRLSIDRVSIDLPGGNVSDTELNLDIDLGASFEINSQMQVRLAALLGDGDAIGLSFVWTPRGLR